MNRFQRAAVIAVLFAPASITAAPAQAQAETETRHYDCSKAGNADKTVCKEAAAKAAAQDATKTRHYDCTKPGNADKEVCKTAAAQTARPAQHSTEPAKGATSHENDDPNGAIAQCKDGKYSHAAHREGACADHGGVARWLSN